VLQFVRRYPQRCSGLVFINTYACWVSRSDYPEGTPPEEIANSRESINKAWGRSGLPAPAAASQAGNEAFLQWNAAIQRAMATPDEVVEGLGALAELDSRDVLPEINVPTLVMARTGLPPGAFARTRYVAEHVPHARFVEIPGFDIAPFYETPQLILDQIEEFIGNRQSISQNRKDRAGRIDPAILSSKRRTANCGQDRSW